SKQIIVLREAVSRAIAIKGRCFFVSPNTFQIFSSISLTLSNAAEAVWAEYERYRESVPCWMPNSRR
ncbi:MAG TPA: hypothetical protein VNR65_13225, partial [Geobacterales bacterium]|nr:hypothetical protein [Geobacterales bacterium]